LSLSNERNEFSHKKRYFNELQEQGHGVLHPSCFGMFFANRVISPDVARRGVKGFDNSPSALLKKHQDQMPVPRTLRNRGDGSLSFHQSAEPNKLD